MRSTSVPLILVVDDTEANRFVVADVLTKSGFRVSRARAGGEALSEIDRSPAPDLVVLDVRLPDITGVGFARRLRAIPEHRSTPILFISAGHAEPGAHVLGLERDADAYLNHPVDPTLLVATVRSLLRTRRAEDVEQLLADASEAFADSLDPIEAARALAAASVPRVADACVVVQPREQGPAPIIRAHQGLQAELERVFKGVSSRQSRRRSERRVGGDRDQARGHGAARRPRAAARHCHVLLDWRSVRRGGGSRAHQHRAPRVAGDRQRASLPRSRRGTPRGTSRECGESRFPGGDEPRAPHTAQRDRRVRGPHGARHPRADHAGAKRRPGADRPERASPRHADRRHSELREARGGPARVRHAASDRRRRARGGPHARSLGVRRERRGLRVRAGRRRRDRVGGSGSPAPGAPQRRRQRGEVHAARRIGRAHERRRRAERAAFLQGHRSRHPDAKSSTRSSSRSCRWTATSTLRRLRGSGSVSPSAAISCAAWTATSSSRASRGADRRSRLSYSAREHLAKQLATLRASPRGAKASPKSESSLARSHRRPR